MSWKKKELVETELPFLGFYDLNLCKGTRTPQETHGVRAQGSFTHAHFQGSHTKEGTSPRLYLPESDVARTVFRQYKTRYA